MDAPTQGTSLGVVTFKMRGITPAKRLILIKQLNIDVVRSTTNLERQKPEITGRRAKINIRRRHGTPHNQGAGKGPIWVIQTEPPPGRVTA